ncbi:hypothetical protein, partial [Methylibium sp. T29]|uniref:hypothetical protein n=1 Tax=Methylibium sp. T29 TaxID=1430884 RepID=UPI001C1E48D4
GAHTLTSPWGCALPATSIRPLGDGHVDASGFLANALPRAGYSRDLACIQAVAATAHCGVKHRSFRT